MNYTRVIRPLVLIAIAGVLTLAQTPAPQKVELSLIVTDKQSKALDKVNINEVRITEDKVEQKILSLEPDERPTDYGLLIDASNSFHTLMSSSLEMARLLIINRRPADEIFIESFVSSDKINTVRDFSSDGDDLLKSLLTIRIEGGQSAIVDALYLAVHHVAEHNKANTGRRKALVIITDGEDRNSYYKVEQLTKLLREEGVQVFALGILVQLDSESGFIRKSPREKAEQFLRTVAEESGGRVFLAKDKAELLEATVQIIKHLRSQFLITYQSTNGQEKQGFRKVDVKLISANDEK